jgi:hypothetical protein
MEMNVGIRRTLSRKKGERWLTLRLRRRQITTSLGVTRLVTLAAGHRLSFARVSHRAPACCQRRHKRRSVNGAALVNALFCLRQAAPLRYQHRAPRRDHIASFFYCSALSAAFAVIK